MIQSVQGYNKDELDDTVAKAAKPLRDQVKQLNDENESLRQGAAKQTADAVAKATAPLRGQITQLQSETPIDIDKLPTSLRLLFKGADIEGIDQKNIVWTRVIGWRERKALLTNNAYPVSIIIIVFRKPIAYKAICFEGHDSSIPVPESAGDPRFAIIQFDVGPAYGLVDLYAANECKK